MYTIEYQTGSNYHNIWNDYKEPFGKVLINFGQNKVNINITDPLLTNEVKAEMEKYGNKNIEFTVNGDYHITMDGRPHTYQSLVNMAKTDAFSTQAEAIKQQYFESAKLNYIYSYQIWLDLAKHNNSYRVDFVYDYTGGQKKPIATLVTFFNINGTIQTYHSICNETDQFDKKKGVEQAIENAQNGIVKIPHRKIALENGKIVRLLDYIVANETLIKAKVNMRVMEKGE